jgi:hypothetical protein
MAKTARLNSKRFRRPAARPIRELRYAKKVLSAYFSPAHCALRPELPKKRRLAEVSSPCNGSPGAAGRRNNHYK